MDGLAALEAELPQWTRVMLPCLPGRSREAFVLRESGLTFRQIADRMGFTCKRASELYERASEVLLAIARRGVHITRCSLTAALDEAGGADPDRVLDMPVEGLGAGVRATNALVRSGILTVRDLLPRTETELLRLKGMGFDSAWLIQTALRTLGLQLATVTSRDVAREQ